MRVWDLYEGLTLLGHIFMHAVPAIRGKDYGKSKMRYPDYTETDSGLQYKVNDWTKYMLLNLYVTFKHLIVQFFFRNSLVLIEKNAGLASGRWSQA